MPQGLQVFNASGELTVDVSDRLTRIIGSVYVTSSGSMSVPDFTMGTPFALVFLDDNALYRIDVEVSGTTLSWDRRDGTNGTIIYGIY